MTKVPINFYICYVKLHHVSDLRNLAKESVAKGLP